MPSHLSPEDTIAALASAPGSAWRSILRLSGRQAAPIIQTLFAADPGADWTTGTAARFHPGQLRIQGLSRPLPVELGYWPTRRSYTGEPLVELHLVGAPPILDAALTSLYQAGARPAQPGEFTLRAFLAGRIDLIQAEAVLGIIDAGNQAELRSALEQFAGGISHEIGRLRSDLLDLLADLEAGLDFADEAIEFVAHGALVERLGRHRAEVERLIRQCQVRARNSSVPRVVLAGPPNAGKSTLFNALVGRDAAIVSETSGTTRDYLAAEASWDGLTFLLIDTAGQEQAPAGIQQEAQRQQRAQLDRADLILWCTPSDVSGAGEAMPGVRPSLSIRTKSDLVATTGHTPDSRIPGVPSETCPRGDAVGQVCPSYRLDGFAARAEAPVSADPVMHGASLPRLAISARAGHGLQELKDQITARLSQPATGDRQWIGSTTARCQGSLTAALAALNRAHDIAESEADQELLAIETREALDALGEVIGAVYTDDILDRIFGKFCIGK